MIIHHSLYIKGLQKCKKLIVPNTGVNLILNYLGECPLLEEIIFYGNCAAGGSDFFKDCPSLHTVRFYATIPNGYLPSVLYNTYVSDIYL